MSLGRRVEIKAMSLGRRGVELKTISLARRGVGLKAMTQGRRRVGKKASLFQLPLHEAVHVPVSFKITDGRHGGLKH